MPGRGSIGSWSLKRRDTQVCESLMQQQPHPFVSSETGNAPFGTVPRRSPVPLRFWIGAYVVWLLVLCALAWMRFFSA